MPTAHAELALEQPERTLGLLLDGFGDALVSAQESGEPHRLCGYLYELASAFAGFYEHCPVLRSADRRVRENRLLFCRLTGLTLERGLALLGIAAPERLWPPPAQLSQAVIRARSEAGSRPWAVRCCSMLP